MTVDMARRVRWCDGWPEVRGHKCDQSQEYHLHIRQWEPRTFVVDACDEWSEIPEGEYDSDIECWLCNDCAARMCATHIVDRIITSKVLRVYKSGDRVTYYDVFGVWKARDVGEPSQGRSKAKGDGMLVQF